ncbi:hypothetical protein F4604DRAFT_1905999 [Suillus subluteus]|nr:hypothetical protein F4604DRAFT_1905999 [Suillus subluteus]
MLYSLTASFENVLKANPQDSRTQQDNIMERSIQHSCCPSRAPLAAWTAQWTGPGYPTPLRPVRLLSASSVGCTGPHHGSGTPAHVNSTLSLFHKLGHEMRGASVVAVIQVGTCGGSGRGALALLCRRC